MGISGERVRWGCLNYCLAVLLINLLPHSHEDFDSLPVT